MAQVVGVGGESVETGQQDKAGESGIDGLVGFDVVGHPLTSNVTKFLVAEYTNP
jgi:hypothetical protein